MSPLFSNIIGSISWLIAIFIPGSALLLVRKNKLAFSIPIIGLVWVALISWSRWVISPTGFMIMLIGLFALHGLSYGLALKSGLKQNYTPIYKVLNVFTLLVLLNASIIVTSHLYKDSWFGFAFYHIPSVSMSPTLEKGDVTLIDTWVYKNQAPQVSDIIIVKRSENSLVLAKRVTQTQIKNNKTELFIEGDNKQRSIDSRRFSWITSGYLIGKVELVWFSFSNIQRLYLTVS